MPLARYGFPLCAGNVMAGNPQWCLSMEEWRATFAEWIQRGDAPVLLKASIFFDFRPLYGPEEPVHELREWLIAEIRADRFLRQMVVNALANRPPLGLLGDFVLRASDDGGALAITVGILAKGQNVAHLVALAFAVAASSNLPAVFLTLYWKRCNTGGIVLGMLVGAISAIASSCSTPPCLGCSAAGRCLNMSNVWSPGAHCRPPAQTVRCHYNVALWWMSRPPASIRSVTR